MFIIIWIENICFILFYGKLKKFNELIVYFLHFCIYYYIYIYYYIHIYYTKFLNYVSFSLPELKFYLELDSHLSVPCSNHQIQKGPQWWGLGVCEIIFVVCTLWGQREAKLAVEN